MIESINILYIVIGCLVILGGTLIGVLSSQVMTNNEELKLKKHRSKDTALADLLIYAAVVDDGIIVGKNGSFMTAWLYKGDDNASSTEAQRETVSARINQAFANMGSGWMIHVDAVRRTSPSYSERNISDFPDEVCAAIDEERRQLFQNLGTMYEGYFVITVTYYPPLLAQRKLVDLMFDDDQKKPDKTAQTYSSIESFKRECLNIESKLSSCLEMERLKANNITTEEGKVITHDDFLSWLQFCITGLSNPVVLPKNPIYLDAIIGGQEMWGGVVPRIGKKYVQVVSIEGFPLESEPGILSALAEKPCEYRWSNRFIFMDAHEAVNHLEKFRKKWKQKIRGFFDQVFNTNSGNIDEDAKDMVADASGAIAEVNSGLVAQGYYTSVITIMDEDRDKLDVSARSIKKAINQLGFAARIESINTMDAFFGGLPGHGVENVRRPLINTMNLADLLPTSTIWTGQQAPCPHYPPLSPALMHCVTNGATPFRLNLHVRDLGHSFMLGLSVNALKMR